MPIVYHRKIGELKPTVGIPVGLSADFIAFYKKLLKNEAKLMTLADLKKHWLWAIEEGADKPVKTREWLCSAMLQMPDVKTYDELPDAYKGIVAALQASEDYIAAENDSIESDRAWNWLKSIISHLAEY